MEKSKTMFIIIGVFYTILSIATLLFLVSNYVVFKSIPGLLSGTDLGVFSFVIDLFFYIIPFSLLIVCNVLMWIFIVRGMFWATIIAMSVPIIYCVFWLVAWYLLWPRIFIIR
jgi:hypothetical protein